MRTIVLFILLASCNDNTNGDTVYLKGRVDSLVVILPADTTQWPFACEGSIGLTSPPTLIGDHKENCSHRKQIEREIRLQQLEEAQP